MKHSDMKWTEYQFEGGPLDGKHQKYRGAEWFGFKYQDGEYVTRTTTYKNNPPKLYWRGPNSTHKEPTWELPEDAEIDSVDLEEHIKRLLDGQQG